eukprot:GHVR01094320.1.p1 GENE.GHVR01094320.1~~GHVR01094320.1.p1  ORF type:complete len:111 (-),score=8.09 GHVR01094320.1:56-388(-)
MMKALIFTVSDVPSGIVHFNVFMCNLIYFCDNVEITLKKDPFEFIRIYCNSGFILSSASVSVYCVCDALVLYCLFYSVSLSVSSDSQTTKLTILLLISCYIYMRGSWNQV